MEKRSAPHGSERLSVQTLNGMWNGETVFRVTWSKKWSFIIFLTQLTLPQIHAFHFLKHTHEFSVISLSESYYFFLTSSGKYPRLNTWDFQESETSITSKNPYLRHLHIREKQYSDVCMFSRCQRIRMAHQQDTLCTWRRCLKCAESLSCVWLFVTPRTVAPQVPLPMEFSRQDCWSGYPFPSPGDLPNPGTEFFTRADSLPAKPQGKPKNTGVGSLTLL